MRKKLSVTLSAICVSACALMAPVSVQGMRSGGSTPNQFFSGMPQREPISEIGRAFHEAARNADFERMAAIVSSARSEGKDIAEEVRNFYQHKPFLPTFLHGCRNPELVRFAVQNGMRELINSQRGPQLTPLMTAHNAAVAQALIENGADVNCVDQLGRTPIFLAKTREITQVLIDNGADINYTNGWGKTPLFCVYSTEVAQALIDNGANVNHTDIFGRTPLMTAFTPEIAQLLINNGADVNHTDNNYLTPIFFAQNAEVAQALIDNGANVNHTDRNNRTPLMCTSNPQIAQVLINNGANIDDLRFNLLGIREQLLRNNSK